VFVKSIILDTVYLKGHFGSHRLSQFQIGLVDIVFCFVTTR